MTDPHDIARRCAGFLTGQPMTGNQVDFVNMVLDHLTEHGLVEPGRLCESP